MSVDTPVEPPAPADDQILGSIVATERYRLHDRDGDDYRSVVRRIRTELESTGCSVVRGFFRADTVHELQRESALLRRHAHFNDVYTNPYSTPDEPSLPPGHPVRTFMHRTNGFVAKEDIPADSRLRRLYHAEPFRRFVSDCLAEPEIHEYADPYAALVLNFLRPGAQHPWHYDTNEFIVSTLVQPCDGGGIFEYCPGIRTPDSECYDRVGRVLHGKDRAPVRELELQAGDLQLFKGRFSLHRVTPNEGSRDRITAIFAYAKEPGVIGRVDRTRFLFGRVSEAHVAAAGRLHRSDGLRD